MVDSTLTEYLTELFLLKSPNQIKSLPFDSIPGKEAIPFRFAIHLENGEEKKVFVKKVSREGRDPLLKGTGSSVDALKWEGNFYQNFLPEIRSFRETHEGMTGDIIDSCFVEYYGYKETEDEIFLVLQDLSEKQCRVPQRIPPRNELEEAVLILQKRAELSGIFYAWKEDKIRSANKHRPFEPFVNIEITKKYVTDGCTILGNVCSSSVTVKILKLLLTNSSAKEHTNLKERCNINSLDKLIRWQMSQNPVICVDEVLLTENNLWGPVLGDFQPLNIAISDKIDQVVFFDFTHFMLSSVMLEFQRYMAICINLDPHHEQLLEVYIDSFIESISRFKLVVSREQLIAEFNLTRFNYIQWRFFMYSFVPMQNAELYNAVSDADINTEEGEATVLRMLEKYPEHWKYINGLVDLVNKIDKEPSQYLT